MNLNDEALPHKFLIGRAILDKNRPRIRLVVNKIGNIENEFRTFPMEILAAEDNIDGSDFSEAVEGLCAGGAGGDSFTAVQVQIGPQHHSLMQVEVREHECRFCLDFARVYFSYSLQGSTPVWSTLSYTMPNAVDSRESQRPGILITAMAARVRRNGPSSPMPRP